MLRGVYIGRRAGQRGLSIVELMVGVAIGLFVVAGASMLVATQLSDNRRLLLETQVQQDLRATADIVARELRRSGHWAKARDGVWYPGTPGVRINPYHTLTATAEGADMADGEASSSILMAYANKGDEALEDDAVAANERRGFRLQGGVIQTQLGEDNWQALTDANTLRVTGFSVSMDKRPVPLACTKPCPGGGEACWPVIEVRELTVDISGEAAHDAAVQRSVRSKVRLRNDPVVGACPA
jgi:prepilin peptidase dependent protein B